LACILITYQSNQPCHEDEISGGHINETLTAEGDDRVQLSLKELEVLIPVRHKGDAFVDYCMEALINMVDVFTPTTRKQALKCEKVDL
jgi:hypothetical protein